MGAEVYQFTASGYQAVESAYRSIAGAADRSATSQASSMRRMAKQQERAWMASQRAAQRAAKDQERAARQAARSVAKEQEKATKERLKQKRKEQREIEKIEREITRDMKRENKKREREAEKSAKDRKRAEEKASNRRWAAVGSIGRSAIRGITRAAAVGAGIGTYMVGRAVRENFELDERAARLAVQGGGDAKKVKQTAVAAALGTRGAKAEGVLGGMERFVTKTGDMAAAERFAPVMAQIAVATGTAAEDIGDAMADLFEKFDIKTVEDMSKSMATLAVQGKRGSFELKDAASQFPRMAAAASVFGLKGSRGLATLGGLTQIAKRATGSPEEASTAIEGMFASMTLNSAKIKKATGVNVFTDKTKTQARDITDLIPELIAGAKGNQEKLRGLIPKRGFSAIAPLVKTFNTAFQGAKGTEQERLAIATAALREEMNKAIDATGAEAEIKRDLATIQETAGAKMTAAWESITATVGREFAPAVATLMSTIAEAVSEKDLTFFTTAMQRGGEAIMGLVAFLESKGLIKPAARDSKKAGAEADVAEGEASLAGIERQKLRDDVGARLTPDQLKKAGGDREKAIDAALSGAETSKLTMLQEQETEAMKKQSLARSGQLVSQTLEGMFAPIQTGQGVTGKSKHFGLAAKENLHALARGGLTGVATDVAGGAAASQGQQMGGEFLAGLSAKSDLTAASFEMLAEQVVALARKASKAAGELDKIKKPPTLKTPG